MNKGFTNTNNNTTKGGFAVPFLPFRIKQKASLLNCRLAFVVHRESLRILPNLITSRLKQRLTIQPNDLLHIQSCANLEVLTGTAFYLFSLCNNGTLQGVI